MHVYFSGIGGTGISSLALIAHQAGYQVSGSDARPSQYLEYLKKHGVTDTHVGVDDDFIKQANAKSPISWYVYGSAQPIDFPDHPEFAFCKAHGIKMSKRDEFLNKLIQDLDLKLIAVAGTHGKTTTTAMVTWVFKELGLPLSYSGGAKLSFGDVSEYDPKSKYFAYEADEFDRNFLSYHPAVALVSGIDYDHPDIYPTRQEYNRAFNDFLDQSDKVIIWDDDAERLGAKASDKIQVLAKADQGIEQVKLPGLVNRQDAWLVANSLKDVVNKPLGELVEVLDRFPGLARRFEQIAPKLYSDYAHTPAKIRGALQLAHETAGNNVVVVYEGLHNTRQHFIKDDLATLFDKVKELYIVPSYLARENQDLELLTPEKLLNMLSNFSKGHAHTAELDSTLKDAIKSHLDKGDLVLCFSSGGGNSLDEWLRQNFS